ncbi:cell wall metabolism sensor histidine kinase WalK [Cellulomonas sp. KRMCY2]|uniref:sensor histidine kinase n=1 Tax=Cellulomonas sp. KRMCY2 TaxID=1304865 RepID=UPI00045E6C3E|nr:HAMP domain-containing sensor histidine kinase [Cellulomonas sp. KRMCY2]
MSHRRRTAAPGIASRLLAALALVVVAGGLTAWLVAGAIGPAIFHQHMVRAGLEEDTAAVLHAEEAFRSAAALSLTVALAAAVVASLAVSLFLTKRIAGSLGALSAAVARIAGGRFDSRVASPRMGPEFDQLSHAFNDMAARLEESQALRRRLLADVAHEVRTPVATLNAYLEGLEDGVETLTPQTVTVLRTQGARLTRLADDLAAVTRVESGELTLHREPTSPAALLDQARAAAEERFAAAGIDLAMEVEPGLPAVLVDPDRMGQVLGNLVDNALRHTPRVGTVELTAHLTEDRRVRLAVVDNGEGIDPQHLAHVFERFYRVDTARDRGHGGSGIGLAIVRALVEAHGGTVSAHSDGLGTGSTFEILLEPATAADRP